MATELAPEDNGRQMSVTAALRASVEGRELEQVALRNAITVLAQYQPVIEAAMALVARWERLTEAARISMRFNHAPLADLVDALAEAVRTEPS